MSCGISSSCVQAAPGQAADGVSADMAQRKAPHQKVHRPVKLLRLSMASAHQMLLRPICLEIIMKLLGCLSCLPAILISRVSMHAAQACSLASTW